MRKTKLLATFLSFTLLISIMALVACGRGQENELYGFDVQESITVDMGTSVLVDVPIVTDKNGMPLDVVYEVVTMSGGGVSVVSNRFFAMNGDGYYINYAVVTSSNQIVRKSTKINVVGSSDLTAEYEVMVDQGSENQIKPITSFANPTYEYKVTYKPTGEEVLVTEGNFVTDKLGFYTIKITATEGNSTAEFEYDIYCREAMQVGEVERFTNEWNEVRNLSNLDTYGWEVTNSTETGVKDRFGRDANYVKLVSSDTYGYFWINPRGDEDYYRQLAEEGYTHVSFWIYLASDVNHDVMSQLYPDKGAYTANIGVITPGIWTQIKVRLVETYNDHSGSFASAVDYFKKQQTYILCFDNAAGYNSGGHEDDMTIYISDVYAVKTIDIKLNEGVSTQYKTGDTINIDEMVNIPEGVEVESLINFRGETIKVENGEYKFTANGTYTLNVIPTPNYVGSGSFVFNVTDNVTSSVLDVQLERTEENITVNYSDLNIQLANGESPVTIDGYKLFMYGRELQAETDNFNTAKDGAYTVEVTGLYEVDGETYRTYYDVIVDVWSEDSKYIVSYNELMFAHSEYCGWLNWDKHPTYANEVVTVGGETFRALKVKKLGQSYLLPMLPMYSKTYYEKLLAENADAMVTVQYYVEADKTTGAIRSMFNSFANSSYKRNQWIVESMSLSKFITLYDTIKTGYEEVKYLMDNNITKTHNRAENDFLFWFSGDYKGETLYVQDLLITTQAETGTAVVKQGSLLALNEENDVCQMVDVTIEGETAKIVTIEVEFEGKWNSLINGKFTPVFGGTYNFKTYVKSGSKFKTLEFSISTDGTHISKTEDKNAKTIMNGQTLDLSPYLYAGYENSVTVDKVIGDIYEPIDCVIENNTITSQTFDEYGLYRITTTLIVNEDSDFGKFIYYILYVNYTDGDAVYNSGTETSVVYTKLWNDWNSSKKPYGSAVIADADDENLAGKTGTYFKAEMKPRWTGDADLVGVQLLPLYSKNYYEDLLNGGMSYSLEFEWMYQSTFDYGHLAENKQPKDFRYRVFGGSAEVQGAKFDTWYKASISLKTLIENWDTLTKVGQTVKDSRHLREILHLRLVGGSAHNMLVGSLYLGNFTLVKQGVVNTNVTLIDTKGVSEYDLTTLYEGALETATYTAVLVDRYENEITVDNARVFDLSTLKQGIYQIVIYENGLKMYTGNIDVYDSSEGLIWQEIDENSVNDARVWKFQYIDMGAPTYGVVGEMKSLQFTPTAVADANNSNFFGVEVRPIHSKEYYELMSENYESITFDVHVKSGLNVKVNGMTQTYGVWQAKNSTVTYTLSLATLLEKWDNVNVVTEANNVFKLFDTFYSDYDTNVISVGNFAGKKISKPSLDAVEISEVQLIETANTPSIDLFELYGNKPTGYDFVATLTALNGDVVNVADPSNIVTADLIQGVYAVNMTADGEICLTAVIDVYTATDGLVWQVMNENVLDYVYASQYSYQEIAQPTLTVDGDAYSISYNTSTSAKYVGYRIKAIHSKEYYQMMSQTYSAITYSISTVGCSATCWESGVAFGTSATQKYLGAGGSATREISLDTILANWDGINTFGLSSNYKNDNLFTFTTWEAGTVNITGFGSVAKIVE